MSFDFGPMNNLSNVQASAKSCPGGGGNTGYFQRGKKEDEDNITKFKETSEDSFEKIELEDLENEDSEESFMDFLKKIYIEFLAKIRKVFEKKVNY